MKISKAVQLVRYYKQFFPFRINFILFLLAIIFIAKWVKSLRIETSSFFGITLLMVKIALFFCGTLVAISFLSAFICWLHFMLSSSSNKQQAVDVRMQTPNSQLAMLQIICKLPFALKPALGFVKMKLMYDQELLTDKLIIANRLKQQFIPFRSGLASNNNLILDDIKEYHFSKAIVFFEDMLQFFSFAVAVDLNQTIFNLPVSVLADAVETTPKKTEEELIRIEQIRKVEGEYLNYKKFESSDDVRRIVWKIFAKNKELVVRIPEIMDPFASHIYLYASFYNHTDFALYPAYQQVFLNRYKNFVWSLYDVLHAKNFEVRYVPDQIHHAPALVSNLTQYSIAVSNWHQDMSLRDYIKPQLASVICLHSFSDVQDVNALLSSVDSNTSFYFIRLSTDLKSNFILNFFSRLFFRPATDTLTPLKSKWAFHTLKFQLLRNEKLLLHTFKKNSIPVEVIA